jgi:prepilin-type N-terminal cleavage/methylation domain-containing protein
MSRWNDARRVVRGFTLLEVLVATTVLAVGIISVMSGVSASVRASSSAAMLRGAVDLAQNQLTLAVAAPVSDGQMQSGTSGRYSWSVSYTPQDGGMILAVVTVRWSERSMERSYELSQLLISRPRAGDPL